MNIDGSREIGGLLIVQPIVIGEPRVRLGQCNQLATPRMVELQLAGCHHRVDTRDGLHELPNFIDAIRLLNVDVGQLMIDDSKGG